MLKEVVKENPQDLIKDCDEYWSVNHSLDYRRAKSLFITFVTFYNQDSSMFNLDVKLATKVIHGLWRCKTPPPSIIAQSERQHETLKQLIPEYYQLMESFLYYDQLKRDVEYYRKYQEPQGLPFERIRGPTGPTGPM